MNFVNFNSAKFLKLLITNSSLSQASFIGTNLHGVDFSTNDISGIVVDKNRLDGFIVNVNQAVDLSKLLGIIIK